MQKKVQIALSVIITGVILFFIFRKINLHDVTTALRTVDPWMVLLAFGLYIIMTFLKGIRWREVLNRRVSTPTSFVYMSINNMFNNLLPFRLGEFSMLYLMKKKGIRMFTTFSFLIILRLFDLFTILLLFFVGVFLTGSQGLLSLSLFSQASFIILFVLLGATALFLIGFFFFHRQCLRLFVRLCKELRIEKKKAVMKAIDLGKSVSSEIGTLAMKRVLWSVTFLSCLAWLATFAFYYVLMVGMGVHLPFHKAMVALALQMVLSNIPIQGLAGFGTYEGFWAISFTLIGMDEKTALLTGINSHLLLLVMTILLGLFGLLVLAFKPKSANYMK